MISGTVTQCYRPASGGCTGSDVRLPLLSQSRQTHYVRRMGCHVTTFGSLSFFTAKYEGWDELTTWKLLCPRTAPIWKILTRKQQIPNSKLVFALRR